MSQSISMVMLGVHSLDVSVPFYRDVMQFDLSSRFPGFAFFAAGGVSLVLSEQLGKAMEQRAGAVEIILPAGSVRIAAEELRTRGAGIFKEPQEVSPGSFAATVRDPDGHLLTVFGPA